MFRNRCWWYYHVLQTDHLSQREKKQNKTVERGLLPKLSCDRADVPWAPQATQCEAKLRVTLQSKAGFPQFSHLMET